MEYTCTNVSRLTVASRNIGYGISHKTSFVKWTIAMPSLTNKDNSGFFSFLSIKMVLFLYWRIHSLLISKYMEILLRIQKEKGIYTSLMFNTTKESFQYVKVLHVKRFLKFFC